MKYLRKSFTLPVQTTTKHEKAADLDEIFAKKREAPTEEQILEKMSDIASNLGRSVKEVKQTVEEGNDVGLAEFISLAGMLGKDHELYIG